VDADGLNRMVFGARHVERPDIVTTPHEPGESVLSVSDLVVRGDRGTRAVDGVSLFVRRGEIVGVAGVAGNGQRELQEAIGGLRPVSAGSISIADVDCTRASARRRADIGLAYVPEDRLGTGLAPGLPLGDNLVIKRFDRPPCSRAGLMSAAAVESIAADLAERFDVRGDRAGMPVSLMSGGNLQKAILARELTADHEVLLAAALTRGLDHNAAEAVRELVRRERDAGRGVLLFSEDLAEVLAMSDVVLVMFRGRIVGRFEHDEVDVDEVGLLMTGAEVA
jgi:simple sugar transport system ATP-binding protein